MTLEYELLDAFSFFLYAFIIYFLSVLSKKLGEAMGMKKYYYLYYLGIFFSLCASFIMVLAIREHSDSVLFGYGYAFFALGLTFGLIASAKYWGWLIKELLKG